VSAPTLVTLTSSAPVTLLVPLKTSSPTAFSTGSDSPVTLASLIVDWPLDDLAVRRNVVARQHQDHVARLQAWASTSSSRPPVPIRRAFVGVSRMMPSIAARAPSAVRVSIRMLISRKKATTPAVWKSRFAIAARIASETSSSMCRCPLHSVWIACAHSGIASSSEPTTASASL
jgi:hypothetical protein